jgi:(1->4)-alpha-D-glucan 1-alpha-D-glucosylmutase
VDWDERRRALADPPPKLRLIQRVLDLRARRPEAFAGLYAPVDAGPDVCAFVRGDAEVLVAVRLRGPVEKPAVAVPGSWRDVLGDAGPVALLERA